MASKFDQKILIDTPSMNVFPLSYRTSLTARMGDLVPVLNKEVVPSDRFRLSMESIIRLAPLVSPVFDRVHADFHAFFVPNRIIDPRWKEFITGGVGYVQSSDSEISPLTFWTADLVRDSSSTTLHEGMNVSSLADYLNLHCYDYDGEGFPTFFNGQDTKRLQSHQFRSIELSALPFLGYLKIWDDWYRNERIQSSIMETGDMYTSPDSRYVSTTFVRNHFRGLKVRNYKKDRFTTALPEPVIGGPVTIPGTSRDAENVPVVSSAYFSNKTLDGTTVSEGGNKVTVNGDPSIGLYARISQAAAATIQELKTAFKMYSFFMKDTYNGNRYVEFIQSHFNRRVPDATIDRAIYLGRSSVDIRFGEVFQTSASTDGKSDALGDYAGRGVGYGSGFLFDDSFVEHGQIYVIMSIVPDATYFQGIDRKFFKKDRFDFLFPEFQNIGDVDINTQELFFVPGNSGSGDVHLANSQGVFGYNSRWMDYKESLDELHGDFLTNMRYWNFSRKFDNPPVISEKFSQVQPQNAPFAVLDDFSDNYMIDILWHCKSLRPLYYYESF